MRLELQVKGGSAVATKRGHDQKTFDTVADVYAYVRQLSGQEIEFAREISPRATHTVEIDYHADCDAQARFKFPDESRYLNIETVDNVEERNREMVCLCREER